MPLTDIVYRLKSASPGAFEILYRELSGRVFHTAMMYLRNEQDAEEVTQDVFLEVHRSVSQFKEDASIQTWMYRITINKSLDMIRYKNRKKRSGMMASLFSKEDGRLLHDPPDFMHPGVKMENREKASHLLKALNQLPEKQKTAFILMKVECLSQAETSEVMKLSVKAVESLFQRAKGNLRKILSDYYEGNN